MIKIKSKQIFIKETYFPKHQQKGKIIDEKLKENFCKNLKKWQSEEKCKIKRKLSQEKVFLTTRMTGIFFLAIIKMENIE